MSRKTMPRFDVHAVITDRILAELERGVKPWLQPWVNASGTGPITRLLRYNRQPYSGINVVLLWSEAVSRGFASPIWMTVRQANQLGAHIRKGEHGTTVVYANTVTKVDEDEEGEEVERQVPFLRAYTVFCADQIEGLPDDYYASSTPVIEPAERIGYADAFFAATGADIRHGGNAAYYMPATDHIQMPSFASFRDAESYVATLAHESIHWTAPPHRADRDLSRYGRDACERAREELVAELGSCFLCADLGIVPELEPRPDHASYLASWLEVLHNDKKAMVAAASQAQRAVEFLHSLQPASGGLQEAA